MKTNYQSALERLDRATSVEALSKLETSFERLYRNGFLTSEQLTELDSKMLHKSNVRRGYENLNKQRKQRITS